MVFEKSGNNLGETTQSPEAKKSGKIDRVNDGLLSGHEHITYNLLFLELRRDSYRILEIDSTGKERFQGFLIL